MVGMETPGIVRLNPMVFRLSCSIGLADLGVELRQQRAQRLEPLAAGRLARRIADQQAQIRLQSRDRWRREA